MSKPTRASTSRPGSSTPISASISRASSSSPSSTSSDSNLASRKIASAGATSACILALSVLVGELVGVAVEDVDERLGREQAQLAHEGPVDLGGDDGGPAVERDLRGLGGLDRGGQVLVALGLLLQPRDRLLQRLQVGQDQLGLDRLDVAGRVDLAVDVGDVLVAEDAGHLADRGRLPDVGEELVAQALALRGAADDAGDVDELDRRGEHLRRTEELGQPRQPLVGNADDTDVGLDRGERVVRREHVVLGQGVEERGLPGVGKSDDADRESHGRGV